MDDFQKKLKALKGMMAAWSAVRAMRGVSADDLLSRVGLEQRRSMMDRAAPWLGGFSAGFIAGGVTGMLLAPMKGSELREKVAQEIGKLRETWLGYGTGADERPGGFDAEKGGQPGAQA